MISNNTKVHNINLLEIYRIVIHEMYDEFNIAYGDKYLQDEKMSQVT